MIITFAGFFKYYLVSNLHLKKCPAGHGSGANAQNPVLNAAEASPLC
jgi:hypothetical protein